MNIILASNSPRRKEILSKAGYSFEVIPSLYDENILNKNYSASLVENCAFNKGMEVKKRINSNSLIISADTVVVLDNKILGKPKDENEAYKMLLSLSNKEHFVSTSISLIYKDAILNGTEVTKVTFRELSETEIKKYLIDKKPFDKAGSYGIQDDGFNFCVKISGNIDNVIGFPMTLFKKLYNKIL